MKVLHLPTTVGGHSTGLSAELKAHGIDSEVWTLNQNYLNYDVDRTITKVSDGPLVRILKLVLAGSYVWRNWDIVHFNSGSTLFSVRFSGYDKRSLVGIFRTLTNALVSLLQRLEIGILRLRGVKLFIHYQGDDARQGDVSLDMFEFSIAQMVDSTYYTPETDEFKRQQIAFLTARCEKTYAVNPDLLHVLPATAEFIPYSHVNLREWEPRFTQENGRKLRILHAPSHRDVKGTQLILDALSDLETAGYEFELILVEGVSNAEARKLYESADVVIDQLFAGWYGGVAVEAMALGKPVMAFIREADLKYIPKQMRDELPILRSSPNTVVTDLKKILEMPRAELTKLAHLSRQYVEKWHNPTSIAERIISDYNTALSRR